MTGGNKPSDPTPKDPPPPTSSSDPQSGQDIVDLEEADDFRRWLRVLKRMQPSAAKPGAAQRLELLERRSGVYIHIGNALGGLVVRWTALVAGGLLIFWPSTVPGLTDLLNQVVQSWDGFAVPAAIALGIIPKLVKELRSTRPLP